MSAVEALADWLYEATDDGSDFWLSREEANHVATLLLALPPSRLGDLLAIRSMPAEQVAELIGGEVAYWTFFRPGEPYAEIRRQGDYDPKRIAARHIKGGTHVERRVQGPWSPLDVSPETNGEQK